MKTKVKNILKLLEKHNISYRFSGINPELTDIKVKSEYTLNGEYKAHWIQCPGTLKKIYQWLGY